MSLDLGTPKVLELVLKLKQYPLLSRTIRERMRQEIFGRGIILPADFEQEVRKKARESQVREGMYDPLVEETADAWKQRLEIVRDDLADFYFAHNCPPDLIEQIVHEVVNPRTPDEDLLLSFNPELAPWAMLFALGEEYESYPPEEKAQVQHHLKEMVVVLTKGMLSDQLDFVGLAREFLTIGDLKAIRQRRIGRGKIGGKSAGMMLAWKIIQRMGPQLDPELFDRVTIPESFFIGADVFYDFQAINDLVRFMNQKYKSLDEIRADYPDVRKSYIGGRFPDDVTESLQSILEQVGNSAIVVRSSSLLEDNFGYSFAGKYDSFFLPNQDTPEKNLEALKRAISQVYASALSPDALAYRRRMGLLDYDERMAVLIQKVVGSRYGTYFYPALAGVAFSHNPFCWNTRIHREDGMVRLVWGLGTRAVDRVSKDYPRMIALSHPTLRPEVGAQQISKYSQHLIDVLNLENNVQETLPVSQLLSGGYPGISLLASINKGDYVQPVFSLLEEPDPHSLVLTFDNLLARTNFVRLLKFVLVVLEQHYQRPVDIEFAVEQIGSRDSQIRLTLLQCRPLSLRQDSQPVKVPEHVPQKDKLFTANRLIPQGIVSGIRYIVWIDPTAYDRIPSPAQQAQVARTVGQLNQALGSENYILIGPGRWGSSNPNLGVKVSYADIDRARVLIEVALAHGEHAPEASYGTHFFQDLVESRIYPLPIYPDDPDILFNWAFFADAPNLLKRFVPECTVSEYVKVIDVAAESGDRRLEIVMDGESEKALGYLK
jgi:pyruvate phosphate dikinase-like enzyme